MAAAALEETTVARQLAKLKKCQVQPRVESGSAAVGPKLPDLHHVLTKSVDYSWLFRGAYTANLVSNQSNLAKELGQAPGVAIAARARLAA